MAVGVHIPYLLQVVRGTVKPHPFTWILWTVLTFIIFFAQLSEQAGPGAWGTGVVALLCLGIVLVTIKNGFRGIKRSDFLTFFAALLAIPLWVITENPMLSVILVTAIDLLAFIPTFRKSWSKPFEEAVYLYGLNVARHCLSLFALMNISIATALFPFSLMLANAALVVFLLWRRSLLRK